MNNKTYIIGIAGGSAGGKSTFAELLGNNLTGNGLSVNILSMDSYFLPESELPIVRSPINNKEYRDYNHPSSFDLEKLNSDVTALSKNKEYQVIIIEGLLTLWDEKLASQLDLKIFVDCSADERIVRRLRRNMQWGLSFDEIVDVYLNLVRFRHDEFVEPTKNRADIILNGSGDFKKPCDTITSYIYTNVSRGKI